MTDSNPGENENENAAEDLLREIFNAELIVRNHETIVSEIKDQLRAAKEELEGAILDLRSLAQDNAESRPLFGKPAAVQEPKTTAEPEPVGNDDSGDVDSVGDWATEPIKVLLHPPIKGMGKAKVDLLIDSVPTLGDFENLRSKVGRDAATLPQLLPKGLGQSIVDELENRQIEFIAKFQTQPVQPAETEATENNSAESTTGGTTADEEQKLLSRLKELETDESGEWMDVRIDKEVWGAGFEAGNAGEEIGECIYLAGTDQDDWLRGWVSANSEWTEEDESEDDDGTAENESEATATTTEEPKISTLAELEDL